MQWQPGKHSFTFGGQDVYVQFNLWTTGNSTPLTYTFSASQTEGYNAAGSGLTTGNSFASYMLGAVSSSSITHQSGVGSALDESLPLGARRL